MRRTYRTRAKCGDLGHFLVLMAHAGCSAERAACKRVAGYEVAFDLHPDASQLVEHIKRPLCCIGCGERFTGGELVIVWTGFSKGE